MELNQEEKDYIKKGQKHWKSIIPKTKKNGGWVTNETLGFSIDHIVDDVWMKAKKYYEEKHKN